MQKISLDPSLCVQCGQCTLVCPNSILQRKTNNECPACIEGGEELCIGCGHCVAACPSGALNVDGIGRSDCLDFDKAAAIRFEHLAHLVRKRRSIRRYSDKPLEDRVIEQLLDVARWSPTARNGLPIKWVIINNPGKVRELAGLVMDWLKKHPNSKRMVDVWNRGGDPVFRGAPCVIGAYTDDLTAHWSPIDSAIAVGTLDLCASAMRLGTCWAGIFVRAAQSEDKPAFNQWFGLAKTETIHGGLMMGHIGEEIYQRIPYRPEAPQIWIR
ncbi:MAG: nitroreductase family protein [Planctomycetaceae bacterium]|jgi:nitroreductase/NAD-dependent dihydropyrimidine dehydrogenase PreA subunit|nr:nitroreductase family protein [Planctomycetaceae bacterium]